MNETRLEAIYNKASTKKLVEMFDRSIKAKHESVRLRQEVDAIRDNIILTVEKRFEKIDSPKKLLENSQFFDMSKYWSIMSASTMKVKSSIKLCGFHSRLNLYLNPKYGIKEYKRFVRYSPFNDLRQFDCHPNMKSRKPYKYAEKTLFIMGGFWDDGTLDFSVLQKIPQLNQGQVHMFMEITKDIIDMVNSWRHFNWLHSGTQSENFAEMQRINSSYMIDNDEKDLKRYRNNLSNLDKLIIFKKNLFIDITKQIIRWEPTLNKWKEANKNFLVLNELRRSKLKI